MTTREQQDVRYWPTTTAYDAVGRPAPAGTPSPTTRRSPPLEGGPMTVIVGIDLSLTSTGVARIDDTITAGLQVLTTTLTSKGRAEATLPERGRRLARLVVAITNEAQDADLVVVESPSFGQTRQGGQHDRAGLWWLVVAELHLRGLPVAEVSPAARAKYATGKGNAAKDQVLAAVVRRYPHVPVVGNDEADALILAAMGARHLGHPVDDLPKVNLEAMHKVQWPEIPVSMGGAA